MPSEIPESHNTEDSRTKDASSNPSERGPISGADIATGNSKEGPYAPKPATQSVSMHNDGIGDKNKSDVMLGLVQSTLHTISNGVEELASSVQDLLGLSDSEGNSSDDYEYFADRGREFSWARLKSRARRRRKERRELKNAQSGVKDGAESEDEESKKAIEILLDVRECDLEQFQSRPSEDDHRLHCFDLLLAGDSLSEDIEKFKETVAKIQSGRITSWKPSNASDQSDEFANEETGEKWIRCIRINSRAVIEMLRQISPQAKGFRSQPIVFDRPFQLLVSLHEKVKDQLKNIERIHLAVVEGRVDLIDTKPVDSWIQKLSREKDSLDQLRYFVDFMERRIMPDARRYRDPSASLPKTIRYDDLWYLIKPGDLVYLARDTSTPDRLRPTTWRQEFLRVIETRLTGTSPKKEPVGYPEFRNNTRNWSLLGHFIDHDGTSFAPVPHSVRPFPTFEGQKKITDLPVYPVSYMEDDQLIAQALPYGATYVNLIERRSGFYRGWTLTSDPFGRRIKQNSTENKFTSPEHIESDILVDFQETFNALPDWKPTYYPGTAETVEKMDIDVFKLERSEVPLLEWDKEGHITCDNFDQVLDTDDTEIVEAKKFVVEDELGQFRQDARKAPTGIYLSLLPRRFFAYAVLERKFVQLDTRSVRSADVEANEKAFEKLEIDRNYKRLILSLVKSHFDKVEREKTTSVEIETQDLIRGKGKGVVILLHGVPGVGKTATAEAVALKWKKPLFPITCGDLGYTAEALEKSLNEIFRLAHHWGCILLLDEADVFITQRERHDLKRNALVSAFLRVLEYYNGIMFLTTNRAGVLDEAIKSRVHLNLYYDHLTEEQTVAIFRQHIQRLRDIERQRNPDPNEQIWVDHKEIIQFAREHYKDRDSNFGRWNGRQIRNAFLIASSLAHYDSEDEGDDQDKDELAEPSRKKQKQLGRSQFEVVAKTTLMYDHYRASVHSGKTDEHVAYEREERAMSSQPRSPTPDRMKNIGQSFGR